MWNTIHDSYKLELMYKISETKKRVNLDVFCVSVEVMRSIYTIKHMYSIYIEWVVKDKFHLGIWYGNFYGAEISLKLTHSKETFFAKSKGSQWIYIFHLVVFNSSFIFLSMRNQCSCLLLSATKLTIRLSIMINTSHF